MNEKFSGYGRAFFMDKDPGTSHWNVWQMEFENGKPLFTLLMEKTTFMVARAEVWRRVVNEGEQVLGRVA